MYAEKPTKTNPQELRILTKPKQHGVVKMYTNDQSVCSESRIKSLDSAIDRLETVWADFSNACEINSAVSEIIYDKSDTFFPGRDIFEMMDKLDDAICSKIKRIKALPGLYQMTKNEAINAFEEYGEPENQSPFGAGNPSLSDVMEDI